MADCKFDRSNFDKLLRELSPKRRKRVVQNSLKSIAAKARKATRDKVASEFATRPRAGKPRKGSKPAWSRKSSPRKDVARQVHSTVYSRKIGFKVWIYNGKRKDPKIMHKNRRGKEKPVLIFNERGSGPRKSIEGYKRGNLPSKSFMKKAARTVDPMVLREFKNTLYDQTVKIAKKYGAT